MIDPVVIDFIARGVPTITSAVATINARLETMERTQTQTASRGAKERVKSATDEAKAKERAALATAREKERIERQITRDAENESKRRDGIVRKSSEMAGRLAEQQAKTEARVAQETTRAIEREEERRMRIRIRSSEMAGRLAASQAAEEVRSAERSARAWGQRGRRIGGIASGSVGSLVSGVGSMVGATLGIGGGMLLADAGRREMSAEKQAALLINTATTGGKPPPEATLGNILGQAGQLSKTLGVDKTDIIGGALEYSRKARGGDIKGALGNMGFFAEMSKVTGADINEIAGAAGTLQSQNSNLKAPEMQQMLLDVYAQGKAGSMSMVDVAKQIGVLSSTRGAYAGNMATNQRKLMALGQLAAPEGSTEEAGTFIKDLTMEAGKHRFSTRDSVGLEQMGVKFNKFGQMDSPEQMIGKVMSYYKGDITKIEKTFGARGKALFGALQPDYVAAGGGAAGDSAVQAKMASVTGATMTIDQLHAQNAQVDSTPGQAFHNALNKITETLEEKLEPRLSHFANDTLPKLIPKFEAIIDAAADFADWFADNPIKGVGAIVLAAIAKDLAAAGIGAAVKMSLQMLLQTMSGGGGGFGGGGLIPTPGGRAGQGLAILGAGTAAVAAAIASTDSDVGSQAAGQRSGVSRLLEDTNLASRIRGGNATPADIAKAQAEATSLATDWTKKGKEITDPKLSGDEWLTVGLAKVTGQGAAADEIIAAKQKAAAQEYDLMGKTLRDVTAALKSLGQQASNTNPGAANRNVPIGQHGR